MIGIGLWRTKQGQILKISDMKTSHINNTINMLYRTHDSWSINTGMVDILDMCPEPFPEKLERIEAKIKEFHQELEVRKEKDKIRTIFE